MGEGIGDWDRRRRSDENDDECKGLKKRRRGG